MATVNDTLGAAMQPQLSWQQFRIAKLIDLSALAPSANDVIQCVNIKAGTIVKKVSQMVVVAEGGTLTYDVGDGADPNGWNDAVNGNASAKTITESVAGTDAYATALGKYYTADDTIDIVLDHDADTAKILLIVEGYYIDNATVASTLNS